MLKHNSAFVDNLVYVICMLHISFTYLILLTFCRRLFPSCERSDIWSGY